MILQEQLYFEISINIIIIGCFTLNVIHIHIRETKMLMLLHLSKYNNFFIMDTV